MITKHPHHHARTASSASAASSSVSTASPSAPTRKRTHLKPNQLTVLQNSFAVNPLPEAPMRNQLARELGVNQRTIQIWFQNRRAKARKLEVLSNSLSAHNPPVAAAAAHHRYPDNPQHGHHHHHHYHQQQQHDSMLLPRWMEQARLHNQPRYQPTFRTMMTPELFEELKQQPPSTRRTNGNRPRSSSKPEKVTSVPAESSSSLSLSCGENAVTEMRAMSEGIPQVHHKQDQQQKETTTVTATERADKTGNNNNSNNEHSSDIVPLLNIQSLRIGSWSRFCGQPAVMGQQATPPCSWDLKCFVESTNKTLTWQVLAEGHLFRIQVPMDTIAQVRLVQEGQLEIELDDPRHCCFAMYDNNSNNSSQGEWIRCGDFSEDKQASRETVHVLLGNHDVLQQALLDLAALAPELTAKMVLTPLPLMDDDLVSCSPSVTPEPLLSFPGATSRSVGGNHYCPPPPPTATAAAFPTNAVGYHPPGSFDKHAAVWATAAAAAGPSALYQMAPYGF